MRRGQCHNASGGWPDGRLHPLESGGLRPGDIELLTVIALEPFDSSVARGHRVVKSGWSFGGAPEVHDIPAAIASVQVTSTGG